MTWQSRTHQVAKNINTDRREVLSFRCHKLWLVIVTAKKRGLLHRLIPSPKLGFLTSYE